MAGDNKMDYAVGVDIGGTFTDIVLLDRASGRSQVGKVLTRPDDLVGAVMEGVGQVLNQSETAPEAIRSFIHGTTLATNAIIERRGAKTALLVTAGFRDMLEMGRESRYDIYDIEIDLPEPLVPRSLVFEAPERIGADGGVVMPLAENKIRALARKLKTLGVEAVAVCFLHAYRNPIHEQSAGALLAEEAPDIAVSLSSEVIPDIGEFERASTTVANAYIRPTISNYLAQLEEQLKTGGIGASLRIVTSDGGTIGCDTALLFPVRLVESGPAGGVLAAEYFGRHTGLSDLIAFDMGGTTAKICVIDGGRPTRSGQFEVARLERFATGSGLPLKVPTLDMIEIGAGGGSIAGVDARGLLQVGPESAGASPGPAAYGLGGDRPTVTDADLYLGYLDPEFFLGGAMPLYKDKAEQAIASQLAIPLNLSLTRAAWGIHEIVCENMARAAKIHCLERGKDPRDYTLVAFGGAGPVHAHRVAVSLGIRRILHPARAGVMSALGFLVAPPAIELMRAENTPLAEIDLAKTRALFSSVEAEGRRLLSSAGLDQDGMEVKREAAMRYRGQSFELVVPVHNGGINRRAIESMGESFRENYLARYHRLNPDLPLEVVNWRVVVSGPRPDIALERVSEGSSLQDAHKGWREVYQPEVSDFVSCPVYDRYKLKSGTRMQGPAIVEEVESTVVVGMGAEVLVDGFNNLDITLTQSAQGLESLGPDQVEVSS
ncbi:MAG: hydantoinase/oxoprolinase family protein [SAR324 cluster bacterium]|nr:hydantoinase/oxoprolinase family protein [SAR324 cluster bacterium]MCZ6841463.1 hydantoinase/oxoprolinase family protein [SAR324 cluster bacterium]